jgi:hypothetical protein
MRSSFQYLRHNLCLLGQREALRCVRPRAEAEYDQMDDNRIRAGDRNAGATETGRHLAPNPATRPQPGSLLATMDHGRHLLSLAHSHGHDPDSAVLAASGPVGLLAAAELPASEDFGGLGLLGEQYVPLLDFFPRDISVRHAGN